MSRLRGTPRPPRSDSARAPWARAGLRAGLLTIAGLLFSTAAFGQAPRIPAATVQRVISAEFAFCGRTESASAGELGTIEAEIQQAIDQAQRRVNGLVADSAAAATALKNAQAKVDEIDGKLSALQVERTEVMSDMKPFEDQLTRLEQGSAAAGAPSEHARLMAREADLRGTITRLTAELERLRKVQGQRTTPVVTQGEDIQGFFQGMTAADGPVAELRQAQADLKNVMDQLRAIRRETIPIRFSPEYLALQRKLEDLNRRIGELDTQLDAATKTRDDAKKAWEEFDLKGLNVAHDENLYAYEHMTRARHCVEKRREQLNQAAPPVSTTMAGSASGKWGVFCRFNDPDYGELTDGGTFTVTFDGRGGVSGNYVGQNGSYAVGGSVQADGSAGGTGSGSGWTVNWSGRFGQAGGGTVGNGGVTVSITSFGGGTCTGTWSIP